VVKYDEKKIDRLLNNEEIIRNKLKIGSVVKNARVFIDIQKEYGSFDAFIWKYVDDKQIKNCYNTIKEIPPKTPLSDRISKDLKKRGMSFVGSTIIYAFMQSIGMVNDHTVDCFRYDEVGKL